MQSNEVGCKTELDMSGVLGFRRMLKTFTWPLSAMTGMTVEDFRRTIGVGTIYDNDKTDILNHCSTSSSPSKLCVSTLFLPRWQVIQCRYIRSNVTRGLD